MKKYYRAVFFSDLHLGMPNSNVELLESFLHKIETDHIYIVGDFLDFWHLRLGKGWSQKCNLLLKRIFKLIGKGTKVTILIGNHDALLYLLNDFHFGNLSIKEKDIHTTKNGQDFIIVHGDIFDGIIGKSHFISMIANCFYDFLMKFKFLNPFITHLKYRMDVVVKNISNYEAKAIEYARQQGCIGIVCGHSHFPDLKYFSDDFKYFGMIYANSGDLIIHNTLIVENEDGNLQLINIETNEIIETKEL